MTKWAWWLLRLNLAHAVFALMGTFLYRQFGFAPPLPFEQMLAIGAMTNIALGSSVSLLALAARCGWPAALGLLAVSVVISGVSEITGVLYGIPFGEYVYPGKMGPQLFGLVPVVIPFAWFMMMAPCYLLARELAPKLWPPLGVAALMLYWDFLMEPVMAHPQIGYWLWTGGGLLFGVPNYNWLGWALVAGVLGVFYHAALRNRQENDGPERALFALQASFTALLGAAHGLWAPLVLWLIGLGIYAFARRNRV